VVAVDRLFEGDVAALFLEKRRTSFMIAASISRRLLEGVLTARIQVADVGADSAFRPAGRPDRRRKVDEESGRRAFCAV